MNRSKLLNQELPNFPHWPHVAAVGGKKEIVVFGDHVGFAVFSSLRKLIILLMGLGLPTSFYLITCCQNFTELIAVFVGYLFVFIPLLYVPRWPLILGIRLFPSRTKVRFTPKGVTLGFRTWKFAPRVNIQFRANRSPMLPHRYQQLMSSFQAGRLNPHAAYELQYRLIEMVYGARIIRITTVADEETAHQYALALQMACDLAQTGSWDGETPQWIARSVRLLFG